MTDFRQAEEQLRQAMLNLRPHVRPFINGAMWIVILLSLAYDLYRYLDGHPRTVWSAVYTYGFGFGYLLVDHFIERKLRRRQLEDEGSEDEG